MGGKVAENPRRRQEAQQRSAQHISNLSDEGNIFVQEITTQY